jgi:CO dehydrogenase/acetyl-CoA synthase alpha subunit
MSETSRRKFIAAAGAGAAVGAVAVTTGAASASTAQPRAGAARERVVAVVGDHRSAEVRLLVGEREVVVHDRDLVTRILNAAGDN